jgi:8-oxo-dGTP pyrophosphatase MutT (NUDIX family)
MKNFLQSIASIFYHLTHKVNTAATKNSERSRVIIFSKTGKVVVSKSWHSDGRWQFPGGGKRKNETSGQGAAREVDEEIGLKLTEEELIFVKKVKFNGNGYKWDLAIYKVQLDSEPALSPLWYEISMAKWLDPSELNIKNSTPDVLICLKHCYNKDYV